MIEEIATGIETGLKEREVNEGGLGPLIIDHRDGTTKQTPTRPVEITEHENGRTGMVKAGGTSANGTGIVAPGAVMMATDRPGEIATSSTTGAVAAGIEATAEDERIVTSLPRRLGGARPALHRRSGSRPRI